MDFEVDSHDGAYKARKYVIHTMCLRLRFLS